MEDKEKINDIIRITHCLKWFEDENFELLKPIQDYGLRDYSLEMETEIAELAKKHNYFQGERNLVNFRIKLTSFLIKRNLI